MIKEEIVKEAVETLQQLFDEYHNKGLLSIYFWGSIITPDFNPQTSDIDSVGFLSDEADFHELDKIREWLPKVNPKLTRLQINFFYLSELTKEKTVRSRLARLATPEQAVFDFPTWQFVVGQKIDDSQFPNITPRQFLNDQFKVVKEREEWAKNPKTMNDTQYYCKSLEWLCVAIHALTNSYKGLSWRRLREQANDDTRHLVMKLSELKQSGWDRKKIDDALPFLYEQSNQLIGKYSNDSSY